MGRWQGSHVAHDRGEVMPDPLTPELAMRTIRDYVCAQCWGGLLLYPIDDRMYHALCRAYGEEHSGYVTKYYAERRREESAGEKLEVRDMLVEAGVIKPEPRQPREKTIKELGY